MHISGPLRFKHHQNSTRRHPERHKRAKRWQEREKERNFGRSGGGRSCGGRSGGVQNPQPQQDRTTQNNNTTATATTQQQQQHNNTTTQQQQQNLAKTHTLKLAKVGLAKVGLAKVGHDPSTACSTMRLEVCSCRPALAQQCARWCEPTMPEFDQLAEAPVNAPVSARQCAHVKPWFLAATTLECVCVCGVCVVCVWCVGGGEEGERGRRREEEG